MLNNALFGFFWVQLGPLGRRLGPFRCPFWSFGVNICIQNSVKLSTIWDPWTKLLTWAYHTITRQYAQNTLIPRKKKIMLWIVFLSILETHSAGISGVCWASLDHFLSIELFLFIYSINSNSLCWKLKL